MFVKGIVNMCNLFGIEGGGKQKSVVLWVLEIHTAGWVNFVRICC